MERTPQSPGGELVQSVEAPQDQAVHATSLPEAPEPWDERAIRTGIESVILDDRPIDNRTARYIAGQLHGGQGSALYALASNGEITDRVMTELVEERAVQSSGVQEWIDALIAYCAS